MAWIELHQSLPGHRKTKQLRRILKITEPLAVGHLCIFWLWCLDNCPDGDVSNVPDCDIAEAAGFKGKNPNDFAAALRESGFIDADNQVHDWYSYAGKLIESRKANAQRMRDKRSREPVQRTCSARVAHVQDTSAVHVQGLPYPTQHNPTVPNQNEEAEEERAPESDPFNPFGEAPIRPPTNTLEAYLMANLAYMSPGNMQELDALEADGATPELIRYAVDEACAAGANKWAYVKAVVNGWIAAKITTVAAAKAAQAAHKTGKARAAPSPANTPQSRAARLFARAAEEEKQQHDAD